MKPLISEQTDKIFPALAQVKKNLQAVVKGTKNPFYKSSYADLNAHLETVEPILLENGLTLFQPPVAESGMNNVITMIVHDASGQYFGGSISVTGSPDAQKVGAAITYFRRFGLNSLLAMSSVDDDGETAVGRGKNTEKKTDTSKTTPASVQEQKPAALPKSTLVPAKEQPKTETVAAPKEETKPARPSFRRPAKPAQETLPALPDFVDDAGHGNDI